MRHTTIVAMSAIKGVRLKILSGLIAACLAFGVPNGCESSGPNQATSNFVPSETVTLVHQADGPELMVVVNAEAEEGPIGVLRQVTLPGVLEATGQVTFDDKLVSTIISRLTGRIEEMRSSQWEMVRRGELVMKVFSPDYMSAEEEYLAATADQSQSGGAGTQTEAFGLQPGFSLASSLKEAAIRKLNLLGFSPVDIAAIRRASSSVWVRSPISGVIVSKNVVRGQAVNPGDQLFALATLQRVWITADIYQDDLARVWVGQPLEAVTASYPTVVFTGMVQRISPTLDPNIHTLQLRCQVDNPGYLLKPQMLARVRLETNHRLALVIPQSALVFDDNGYFVFIVTGANTVERRRVEVADWNEGGYARVVRGMTPSDRFLTTKSLKFNALWHAARARTS